MYIKLIQPKMTKRPMDTELKIRMSPPLGLYTIASMFAERHKVVVENENITPIVWDDAPDVVGITITVNLIYCLGPLRLLASFESAGRKWWPEEFILLRLQKRSLKIVLMRCALGLQSLPGHKLSMTLNMGV